MFLEPDEMKFAILFTLKKYEAPISMPKLCDILTWDKQVMQYFDVAIMLNELIDDGFVESKFYRDERAFELNEKGSDTNDFFSERIPPSVRRRIEKAVSELKFDEQYNPNSVSTEVLPVAPHQYMTALTMLDSNTPMLELKIHTGSRSDSEKAAKILKEEADDIYKSIINRIIGK